MLTTSCTWAPCRRIGVPASGLVQFYARDRTERQTQFPGRGGQGLVIVWPSIRRLGTAGRTAMRRRNSIWIALGALVAACTGAWAQAPAGDAAKYPEQMVRLVVPFSAGSMTDLLARVVVEKLSERWKQQVIVENRPGLAGTSSVAKATADGYTLMLTSNGHTVIGNLNKNLAFDPVKDFVGVTQVATTPLILVAPPESPTKTVNELIAAAKARPGTLNYSSAGLGSTT